MPQAPPEDFDWSKLGFTTRSTAGMVVCTWRTGSWSAPEVQESRCLEVDALASGLQYGQSCFEGLKAFRSVTDAKIRIFRPDLNAKRLQRSCAACCMPAPSADLFLRMLRQAVQLNSKWVPPAACGGSLYIRPFVFGSGPELGLLPPAEFKFVILVNPVGAFYPNGISQGVPALIKLGYDRAAPCGTVSIIFFLWRLL